MLVIVIPDVHLKYWLFRQADNLLKHGVADTAVCLMDIPDDWFSSSTTLRHIRRRSRSRGSRC